ncbi:NAD(P)H-binding protein [Fructilactobacillus vespulae]|uniref:NAD(P)H-binding protein n=1 Tax=Fructilactobacillus vespulae TaxID=1249630 RepID=UPI0039B5B192
MNVIILGASGRIARLVENQVINNADYQDVKLTLFLRNSARLNDLKDNNQVSLFEGDLNNETDLEKAIDGQDLVIDATGAAGSTTPTKNIIQAMKLNKVARVVSINDLGIYHEVPGKFGEWNASMIGNAVETGNQTATMYEESGLNYTVLRLAWLSNDDVNDYELTPKGTEFKGTTVSRKSVADVMLNIIKNPNYLANANVGINQPNTDGDKPLHY